jgi:hypothetical protein
LASRDRAVLYPVAAYTGLRESELASLTPESFDLDSNPPAVTVEAAYSKHRRKDTQPLRSDLAALLRDWMKDKPTGKRLWPGGWGRHGAKMVRADLEAASAAKKKADPKSTGIPYRDVAGRVFDFHALHQFISSLAAAGIHPKVAQALARHSTIPLTMDRYSHVHLFDQTAALDKLPELPGAGLEGQADALRAPGTDPAPRPRLDQTGDVSCGSVTTIETKPPEGPAREGGQKSLKIKAFASDCEPLTTADKGEAPPGFEPGMADLQSAAFPLG